MESVKQQTKPKAENAGPVLVTGKRQKEHRERVLRTLRGQRRRWLLALAVAAVTLGSGVLNLFSIMGGPSHPAFLREIFPIEFIRLSRTLTLLIGFALMISSVNIYKRKRRAWAVVLGLSSLSVIFHLTRGLDYEEALFSFALVVLLLAARKIFSVRSSVPDVRGTLLRLAIAAAAAIGYGVAGFWFLDRKHFDINFHIGDSIATTLRFLSLNGDARLVPHTHYAQWFLFSLYLISASAVVYAGFALFRPVIYQLRTLPRERAIAAQIVEEYSRTTLDYFKLWYDKSYFFSPSHSCFIAYRVAGNVALALGDPVGPEKEIEPTLREFVEFCRDNGWGMGFHQVLPDFLPIYRRVRLKKLKIGDDAIVDLKSFTMEGKAKKEFRYKLRQMEGLGVEARHYEAPVPSEVVAELKEVSDEWLEIPGRRERTFTLGLFDDNYVKSTPVLVAADKEGKVLAFVNIIATPDEKEITIDLMRRRTEAPNGVMDYLFVKLFLYAKERGFERFNLGMAPMAGFQEREEASAEERAIHSFFQQLNFLFSFRGLRQYKAKFATSWEPRYLIYRHPLELPRLALALRRVSELKEDESTIGEQDEV
jgi:phosphatidylglycerol lysyltransferase